MTKFLFMNNKFIKMSFMMYMLLFMLILSTLITINSSSWINAWMGMEINLMSFIPLMMSKLKNNSNSMMMYFIIQAGASSMFIIMIILMKMQNFLKNIHMMNFMEMSLLMKLGASPFHWWTPKIIINLNWLNCLIFLTWQKIAPLFLIYSFINNNSIIYLSALLSTFMGTIMGINQTMLKLILMYSSINHLGWILMSLYMSFNLFIYYFLIYSIINLLICMMLSISNFNFLNQMFKNDNQNMTKKIISMSLFLSLSGLPPMLGFLPKFFTLIMMIKNNMLMETMIFINMAIISLSFYINPMLSMLTLSKFNTKWNNKNQSLFKIMMSILLFNLTMILIIMFPMINNIN